VPQSARTPTRHRRAGGTSLDPDAGPGRPGKKDSYVGRQLRPGTGRGWLDQTGPHDDPRAHSLQQYFLTNLPDQGPARIVHGDYGPHNCLVGPDCTVAAVVDWEISTLGDPLADLAYALNFWPDPMDSVVTKEDAATGVPGFPGRAYMAQRYAERTGRDLSRLDYYVGFNRWKSAAIVHGVYARYMEGKKSTAGVDLDALRLRVDQSLVLAAEAVERLERRSA
jgi:aminoglycoside phosphotransferase (APT) family kinase protein